MSRLPGIPKLVAHDRLLRAEFERRYAAMPENVKAELLDGVVWFADGAGRLVQHGRPLATLASWMAFYRCETPGIDGGINSSLRLSDLDEPQPDLLLRIPAERGGSSPIDAEGFLAGAPELVAEVTDDASRYDLHEKLDVYCRFGVREYVVHRFGDREVDWFVWRDGRYTRHRVDDDGCYHSTVFPGLWLDAGALLRDDLSGLQAAVERGVKDPEHARFVQRMRGS